MLQTDRLTKTALRLLVTNVSHLNDRWTKIDFNPKQIWTWEFWKVVTNINYNKGTVPRKLSQTLNQLSYWGSDIRRYIKHGTTWLCVTDRQVKHDYHLPQWLHSILSLYHPHLNMEGLVLQTDRDWLTLHMIHYILVIIVYYLWVTEGHVTYGLHLGYIWVTYGLKK